MKHVWILGSSNLDLTYQVEQIPLVGSTVEATATAKGTGGKGANQAIAISYWDAKVSFIGAVGDDETGELLLSRLADSNVDVRNVLRVPGQPSGTAVVYVDRAGDNCIVVYPGANHAVPPAIFEKIPFEKGELLVSQLEVNIDAVERAFVVACDRGVRTILNPSPLTEIPRELLENTSVLIANRNEAEEIGGKKIRNPDEAQECAERILSLGPVEVVITLGGDGALLYNEEERFQVPGVDVTPVDTQGAGDAFLGAFVAMLAVGTPKKQALAFANRVAAYSVTRLGSTQVSLPSKDDPFLGSEKRSFTIQP